MSLDPRLLGLLLCPSCKGPLSVERDGRGVPARLGCPADRISFPIRDGIPVMLESESEPWDPDGVAATVSAASTASAASADSVASSDAPDAR